MKPKEYWIYENGEEPCLAFQEIVIGNDEDSILESCIRVIEKSAYAKVLSELQLARETISLCNRIINKAEVRALKNSGVKIDDKLFADLRKTLQSRTNNLKRFLKVHDI